MTESMGVRLQISGSVLNRFARGTFSTDSAAVKMRHERFWYVKRTFDSYADNSGFLHV